MQYIRRDHRGSAETNGPSADVIDAVTGTPDTLQECRDTARRTDLYGQIDITDVDAEFERRRRDQGFELTRLEPTLGIEPMLTGQAAMMCRDQILVDALGQVSGQELGKPSRVDEDQCRAMLVDEFGEPIVDLGPDFSAAMTGDNADRGTSIPRSRSRTKPVSTIVQSRSESKASTFVAEFFSCPEKPECPSKNSAIFSIGFWVAEMPMRFGGDGHKAASRSSDNIRCAPRLLSATACSSSTITVRTVPSMSRPDYGRQQYI